MSATTTATAVVNVRDFRSDDDLPPGFVYVGRAVPRHRLRCVRTASPLANPKSLQGDLDRYRDHVLSSPELLALLPSLRGRTLGCWCCADPSPTDTPPEQVVCHAQVLARLAEGLDR